MRLIESYLHGASLGIPATIGVLVEVEADIDGKENREDVRRLAYEIAMQIAATSPSHVGDRLIQKKEFSEDDDDEESHDLLMQSYVKDPEKMIREVIYETEKKIGRSIRIKRFIRYDVSDT